MSFCPKCGKQTGLGSKFCQNCGQTLEQLQSQGNTQNMGRQHPPLYDQSPPQIPTSTTTYSDDNYQKANTQNGLVTGSYICAALSLLILPIIFGPIGVVLGIIASSNGDERGTTAAIVSGVCTFLGMVIGMLVFASSF